MFDEISTKPDRFNFESTTLARVDSGATKLGRRAPYYRLCPAAFIFLRIIVPFAPESFPPPQASRVELVR